MHHSRYSSDGIGSSEKSVILIYIKCFRMLECVLWKHMYANIDKNNFTHLSCVSVVPVSLLCQTLATAQGNILDNGELVDSLNQTKASSTLIQESLLESHRLQTCLDQVIVCICATQKYGYIISAHIMVLLLFLYMCKFMEVLHIIKNIFFHCTSNLLFIYA